MPIDRKAAKAAGYTDEEIDAYEAASGDSANLSSARPEQGAVSFDRPAAKAAGYTDAEIDAYLRSNTQAEALPTPLEGLPEETTGAGLAGAALRGLAPVGAGAALGAGIGSLVGGVGAIPGAAAGAAAGGLATMIGDPLVDAANSALGTNITRPTEGINNLLTLAGIPAPATGEERTVESAARAVGGVASGVGLGNVLAASASPVVRGVGGVLTTQPGVQAASALASGAAGQQVTEAGGGPNTRLLAELGTSLGVAGALNAGRAVANRAALAGEPDAAAIRTVAELRADPNLLRQTYAALESSLGRRPTLAEVLGPLGQRLRRSMAAAPETPEMVVEARRAAARDDQQSLRAAVTPAARNAERLTDNASRRADIEFERFRQTEVPLSIKEVEDLKLLAEEMPEIFQRMPRPELRSLVAKINSQDLSPITGNELDLLRRAARELVVKEGSQAYRTEAEKIENLLADYIPEARRAVTNYARRMSRAEGAEIGQRITSTPPSTFAQRVERPELTRPSGINASDDKLLATLRAKDRGRLARKGGVRGGALQAFADQVDDNVGAAYALASRMETEGGLTANVRAALLPGEAEQVVSFMRAHKQAMDSLSSITGVPPQQLGTVADDAKLAMDTAILAFDNAGGAMKSNTFLRFLNQRLGVGQRSARNLTRMLLDPAKTETAIRNLERIGVPRPVLGRAVMGSLVATVQEDLPSGEAPQ